MKHTLTNLLLLGIFISLLCIGQQLINQNSEKSNTKSHNIVLEDIDDADYYDKKVLEEVPLTDNETPELSNYRKKLSQWYEADNECMGMMPDTKPKDPRK